MDLDMNIAVVYGGISTEREISLNSGNAIYRALTNYGYTNVWLFDLQEDNIGDLISKRPDIAFLALHGKGGEDGCIQGALDLAKILYTGSGVACSAICMNKVLTKQVLSAANLPTAKFAKYWKNDVSDMASLKKQLIDTIGIPMVLKPPCQGSSIGVFIVKDESEIEDAIIQVFRLGNQLLAEEFLNGVEITLPIIGNDNITILPDVEITSERAFYDYKAKYTQGLCHHIIPSRISESDRMKVHEIGEKVYMELKCRGIARIDFIIDKEKGPMVIEVNTLPGMTEMSLVPDSARAMGITFEELTSRLAVFGVEEHRK